MLHMASVRMSERTRDELKASIEEKFLTADPKPTIDSSLSQVILDAMLKHPAYQKATAFLQDPDIKALVAKPTGGTLKAYLSAFRTTKIVKRIDIQGFQFNGREQEFKVSLAMPASMHFANAYGEYMEVHLDDFEPGAKATLIAEMTTKAQELLDWTKRHDDFMLNAQNLLANCNTVGQFLEAWPSAESLLSNEIRQKLNDNSKKSTRDLAAAEARAKFDASQAAPTLLAAEILTSAGHAHNPDESN